MISRNNCFHFFFIMHYRKLQNDLRLLTDEASALHEGHRVTRVMLQRLGSIFY